MKYERLTERDKHGNADLIDADLLDVYDCVSFNRSYFEIIEAIQRLAELEDKIERGELISTVQDEQSEQEIAFFVKHNAEVRKQAVKEFAEICKEKFSYAGGAKPFRFYVCSEQGIDELVKEVCGDEPNNDRLR